MHTYSLQPVSRYAVNPDVQEMPAKKFVSICFKQRKNI